MKLHLLLPGITVLIFVILPVIVYAKCTGTIPTNATLCVNDNKGVTLNAPYTLKDQCSDEKCEYTCKTGFVRSENTCVQCTGVVPTNAMLCSDDDTGLTTNTTRTLTEQCTDIKCEYTCKDGFVKYKNVCVGCIGITPNNAQMCTADDQGLTTNVTKTVVPSCTDKVKCQFTCNSGYAKDGAKNNCIPACKGTPTNATMCADDDQGVATALISTVSTKGCTDKTKCEFTCNAGFAKDPKTQNCVRSCMSEPSNATICADDDQGVTTAVASTVLTTACKNNTKKCEFTCNAGFAKDGAKNNCIPACKGTPTNATMCADDDKNVPTALTSTVVTAGCTDKMKCQFTCNSGYLKDPKTQNCVYPCLNAQSSAKATMCEGDDQNVGLIAIASTVKKFGSACTAAKKCEFICKQDYELVDGKCIPKKCTDNKKPALQDGDPECWTSRVTKTTTCKWTHSFTQIGCWCPNGTDYRRNLDESCAVGCFDGATFDNYVDGCGGTHCTNNPTYPDTWGQTWTSYTYAYDCHYSTVNTWGECDVDTGTQLATGITQNIALNTKDCTNLSESFVRYCGICGNGIQEMEEVCDDGNQVDGDGCSGLCRLEIEGDPTEPVFDPRDYIDNPSDGLDDGNSSDADDNNGVNGRMIETRP